MASPIIKIYSPLFGSKNITYGTVYNDVVQSETLTASLISASGVSTFSITCLSSSDNTTPQSPTITYVPASFSYTIVLPQIDGAWLFQSQINGGVNSTGQIDSTLTYQFKLQQSNGNKNYLCYGESQENSISSGWINMVNKPLYNSVPNDLYTTGSDCIMNWDCSTYVQTNIVTNYYTTITDLKGVSNLVNVGNAYPISTTPVINTKPYGKGLSLGAASTPTQFLSTYSTQNNTETYSIICDVDQNNATSSVASGVVFGRFQTGSTGVYWGVSAVGGRYVGQYVATGGGQLTTATYLAIPKKPHLLTVSINYTSGIIVWSVNGNTTPNAIISTGLYATPPTGNIYVNQFAADTGNFNLSLYNMRYHNTYNPPGVNPRYHQILTESCYSV